MVIPPLNAEKLKTLLCESLFPEWTRLAEGVEARFVVDSVWHSARKKWQYEQKFRKGGKTQCSLFAAESAMGFMVVFGRAERERFDARRGEFSAPVLEAYDAARTYHDGKWIFFELQDGGLFANFIRLLLIKRRPDKVFEND